MHGDGPSHGGSHGLTQWDVTQGPYRVQMDKGLYLLKSLSKSSFTFHKKRDEHDEISIHQNARQH